MVDITSGNGANQSDEFAHQFLIVLQGSSPLIWRRMLIPEDYLFWDLHVAIQDAMGWSDCHLHEFVAYHHERGRLERFGLPNEDFEPGPDYQLDWETEVSDYVEEHLPPMKYLYDFGDGWQHAVIYEGTEVVASSEQLPRCLAGAMACPLEDSGGVRGYAELLVVLGDSSHPRFVEMQEWVGPGFDPKAFSAAEVQFDDPVKRWHVMMEA